MVFMIPYLILTCSFCYDCEHYETIKFVILRPLDLEAIM